MHGSREYLMGCIPHAVGDIYLHRAGMDGSRGYLMGCIPRVAGDIYYTIQVYMEVADI